MFSSRDMFPCLCLIYPGCQVQARSCDVPSGPGPTTQGRLRPPESGADPLQQCPGRIPGCAGEAAAARPSGHDAGPEEDVCRGGGKKGRVCGRRDRESQGAECSSRRRRILSPPLLTSPDCNAGLQTGWFRSCLHGRQVARPRNIAAAQFNFWRRATSGMLLLWAT